MKDDFWDTQSRAIGQSHVRHLPEGIEITVLGLLSTDDPEDILSASYLKIRDGKEGSKIKTPYIQISLFNRPSEDTGHNRKRLREALSDALKKAGLKFTDPFPDLMLAHINHIDDTNHEPITAPEIFVALANAGIVQPETAQAALKPYPKYLLQLKGNTHIEDLVAEKYGLTTEQLLTAMKTAQSKGRFSKSGWYKEPGPYTGSPDR